MIELWIWIVTRWLVFTVRRCKASISWSSGFAYYDTQWQGLNFDMYCNGLLLDYFVSCFRRVFARAGR